MRGAHGRTLLLRILAAGGGAGLDAAQRQILHARRAMMQASPTLRIA
jgi:hypothetical protein